MTAVAMLADQRDPDVVAKMVKLQNLSSAILRARAVVAEAKNRKDLIEANIALARLLQDRKNLMTTLPRLRLVVVN